MMRVYKTRREKFAARPQRDPEQTQPKPADPGGHDLRGSQRTASKMLKREGIIHSVLNASITSRSRKSSRAPASAAR